ncbi:hypothetical protein VTO42DRAFT_1937 [Malbranchea cinnamomea]
MISSSEQRPASPPEKAEVELVADCKESCPDGTVGFDKKATRRLLRKIDLALLPFVALLYLLSFLDRANIGNARLAGLEEDLGMSGLDYNIAVVSFFPLYILSEIPSNLMLKRVRPSIWIPSIMVAWSICATLMGIVHNLAGLIATRAALGFAEGGLFPGVSFYITMWYRRQECGLRIALFFSAATCAGAFGGLLARAIMEMDGLAGRAGWSWIFIIEGLITFVVAAAAYLFMTDYPFEAKFLTPDERREVERRLSEDRSSLAEEFDIRYFFDAVKDWKIWTHMMITIGNYTPLYCVSLFLPTIVKTLGYENETAQLMSVPPYVVACLVCVGGGYLADRLNTRGVFMIGFLSCAIVGTIMLVCTQNPAVKYAGCVIATTGIYGPVPQGVAWNSGNAGGALKRSVAIAMHVGFGNVGGIIASFIFLPKDSPKFIPGFCILIGFLTMSLILSVIMTTYLRRENARRDREYKPPAEYSDEEREMERTKGDHATFFRYVV